MDKERQGLSVRMESAQDKSRFIVEDATETIT